LLADALPPGTAPDYVQCGPATEVSSVSADSRAVPPGAAFIAVPGTTHDGHAFLADAERAGAAVVLLQRGRPCSPTVPQVWLPDTAAALPQIAANAFGRPADALALAAVTGTNGKTTTAHLVGAMLRQAGRAYVRLGTTGNWIVDHEGPAALTTPFPLELHGTLAGAVARGARFGVMEVSSHALMQDRVAPLRFTAAGMTSFSQDHLDFHGSMENYLEAKLRLVRGFLAPGALTVAAIDSDPAMLRFVSESALHGATAWRASQTAPEAEIRARDITFGAHRTTARVETPVGAFDLSSPLLARYNLDNMLVAVGLAIGLGVALEDIAAALVHAQGAPGRLERVSVEGRPGPSVVVDYAHTPDAVERAIAAVRAVARGRVFVVLGCGGDRDRTKRAPMGRIAAHGCDRFWATSDNPRNEDPRAILADMVAGVAHADRAKVIVQPDRAKAIEQAIALALPEDWVLIAGKGHEDYQIIGTRRFPFDDREHARRALSSRTPP